MVAGFTGWNDAGDAASGAVEHLFQAWGAQPLAEIEPEEFVDFSVNRPRIVVDAGVVSSLSWPSTRFGWCSPGPTSVVLVSAPEPQFRWRAYCEAVLEVADAVGCSTVISVGSMLSDVPHTRPTPVFTNAHDPALIDATSLPASHYDGPTGIPGVLQHAAHASGFDTLSLWSAVPAYAATVPSPMATLALVREVASIVGAPVELDQLEAAAGDYLAHLDSLCEDDEDTAEYVQRLEESYDSESATLRSADDLVEEVEKFLKDQ
jgi:hypothetical protein